MFRSLGACHVYNINQLTGLIPNFHIWSLCRCFFFHPTFNVPAQIYLAIFYNRSLLPIQRVPAMAFLQQPVFHTSCCHLCLFICFSLCLFRYSLPAVSIVAKTLAVQMSEICNTLPPTYSIISA